MITDDVEKILLASWIQGDNKEDMWMFSAEDFPEYGDVFTSLKEGIEDAYGIVKDTGRQPIIVSNIVTSYFPGLYESAMQEMSKSLAYKYIMRHTDLKPKQIADAMKRFERASNELPQAPEDPAQILIDIFDERRNTPFVPTGLPSLDRMLNGIHRKEMTAVGARPSVGKSAFVQQIAMHVARKGHKVLFFPLEMSAAAVFERMFMRSSDVSQYEVRSGLKDETWQDPSTAQALEEVNEYFKDGNLKVFERCNNLQTIRRLIEVHKPYMIVIDQLEQLTDGNHKWQDKRARFSHMTHEMQAIALDMDVAVWFACQVNRSADDSMPTLANLKESGTIEEDSDNVILLHKKEDIGACRNMVLNLAKQRNGEVGEFNMIFLASKYTFYEQERND